MTPHEVVKDSLEKIICLFNQRKHYKNRVKLRKGSTLPFLLAKKIDEKPVLNGRLEKCLVWKYNNHIYLTQNNQLQTYIKK